MEKRWCSEFQPEDGGEEDKDLAWSCAALQPLLQTQNCKGTSKKKGDTQVHYQCFSMLDLCPQKWSETSWGCKLEMFVLDISCLLLCFPTVKDCFWHRQTTACAEALTLGTLLAAGLPLSFSLFGDL